MTDPTLSGGMEPLLEALALALRRTYPSRGAIEWVDRLASQYGESRVIAKLGEASQQADPGKVLSLTEEMLEFEDAMRERKERREKEREQEEARKQRNDSQIRYLREAQQRATADPRPLSEIMPDVAERFGKRGNTEE